MTVAFLFCASLAVAPSCSALDRGSRYTLTVSVNDANAGSVTNASGTYSTGTSVQVVEQPAVGYVFDGWYLNGNYEGKQPTITVTVYQDSVLLAVFSKRMVTLTITVNPKDGGETAPLHDVWTYQYGESVLIKEFPKHDYIFEGWYVDGLYRGATTNITVLMDGDHEVDAFFGFTSNATHTPTQTGSPGFTQSAEPTPESTDEMNEMFLIEILSGALIVTIILLIVVLIILRRK